MPKLSIITINYNNFEGLKRTVESVFDQTWQEFEYIVIDGGSTDGSKEYIESQNDKIDYWVSEPDLGIYNAMNKGIVKASGEYLLFLNSGDHFYSDSVLEKNTKHLMLSDFICFNLNVDVGGKCYKIKYPNKLSFSYLYYETLPHPSTFINTRLFKLFGGYDESFKIVSDWKFFIISICKHNCSYIKIDEVLSTFYTDGISSNPDNLKLIMEERDKVLLAEFNNFVQDTVELNKLRILVRNLKRSRVISWLTKLGLLKKI